MKRKITCLGRFFAAAALLWGVTSAVSAQSVKIDFPFASTSEQPTIEPVGVITYTGYTLGDGVSLNSDPATYKDTGGSSTEYKAVSFKHPSAAGDLVTFNFHVPTGCVFTPTNFSCFAWKNGTDAGTMTIYLVDAAGTKHAVSEEGFSLVRSGKSTGDGGADVPTTVETDLKDITIGAGTMSIEVYMTESGSDKEYAVGGIVLEGTYESNGIRVAYFTDDDVVSSTSYEDLYVTLSANEDFAVTPIGYTSLTFTEEMVAEYAGNYDVAVFAGAGGSGLNAATSWYLFLGKMPVLTTKAFWFACGNPSGTKGTNPVSGDESRYMVVTATDHALFNGITLADGNTFALFNTYEDTPSRYLQGNGTLPGKKPQTALSTVYTSTTTNVGEAWYNGVGTVVIPFDAVTATMSEGAFTEDAATLFANAIDYLTDGEIGSIEAPTIAVEPQTDDSNPDAENYTCYDLTLTAVEGASIYYTTDGTDPSDVSGELYTEPVTLIQGCVIKAIAYAPKCYDSEITSYTFVNDRIAPLADPTITYEQGDAYVTVTITTTDEGDDFAIYYTIDGSDPTESSNVYSAPFKVYEASFVVKAVAMGATYNSSQIVSSEEIVNSGYVPMEKTIYYSNFYDTPANELNSEGEADSWYYAETTSQLTQEEQDQGITMDTESTPRPNIFAKSDANPNEYRQYNGWSFYAGNSRRILIQKGLNPSNADASTGACYMLAAAVDGSAAPMEAFEGPFVVEIYAKGGSSESADVYIVVSDTAEPATADECEVIGKATVGTSAAERVRVTYTDEGTKFVRIYTNSTELYLHDYRIKSYGYDELELNSISPAGGSSLDAPATIEASQSEFVVTYNNPISSVEMASFTTSSVSNTNNCTVVIEDNVVTVTRPDAETDLAEGTYRLRLQVTDVESQELTTSFFYMVEEAVVPEAEGDVAYVYQSSYSSGLTPDSDPFVSLISGDYTVVAVDMDEVGTGTAPDIEYLSGFKLVILSEAMPGNTTYTNGLVDLVGKVPVISFKDFNYTSGRWSWATPANPTKGTTYVTPTEAGLAHEIFDGVTPDADGNVTIFDTSDDQNNQIQAWQLSTMLEAMTASNPTVLATTAGNDDYCTIHVSEPTDGSRYVLLPFSSDALGKGTSGVTEDAENIFLNALAWVLPEEEGGDQGGEGGNEGAYSGSFTIDFPFASTSDVAAITPSELLSYDGYTLGEGVSYKQVRVFQDADGNKYDQYTFCTFAPSIYNDVPDTTGNYTAYTGTLFTVDFTVAEGCTLTPENFSCAAMNRGTDAGTMTIYLNTSDGGRYRISEEGFELVRSEKNGADPSLVDYAISGVKVPEGAMNIEVFVAETNPNSKEYGACNFLLTGTYTSQTEFEEPSSAVVAPAEAAKTAVGVEYFSITGAAQNGLVKGINLVRTVYDDGSVEVTKVLSNE